MEKADLTDAIAKVRETWNATIDELGPEGLERPGVTGEWRVRDVLAHFNGWDRWQLVQLRCAFTGEEPSDDELTGGISYPENDNMQEDAMNEMFVAGTRDLPTQTILDHWREVSQMRADWGAAASQEQLDALIGADWSGGPRIMRLASEVPAVQNPAPVWQAIRDQLIHQEQHHKAVTESLRT